MKSLLTGILLYVPGSIVAFLAFLIYRVDSKTRQDRVELARGDCYFILAHFLDRYDRLTQESVTRLEATRVLWKKNPKLIIVNGGMSKGSKISQGRAARDYLIMRGIPKESVVGGDEGFDTLDEVQLLADHMQARSLKMPIAVTNLWQLMQLEVAFHLRRMNALYLQTPLRIGGLEGMKYRFTRCVAIVLTLFDPKGSSWIFRVLRRGRAETWGSRI